MVESEVAQCPATIQCAHAMLLNFLRHGYATNTRVQCVVFGGYSPATRLDLAFRYLPVEDVYRESH